MSLSGSSTALAYGALPGSTVALAMGDVPAAPLQRTNAEPLSTMPVTSAVAPGSEPEITDG
jgi:hypothetical protein